MSVAFLMGVYPARGLEYELSSDGTYYIVTGIGKYKDTALIIPNEYRGKPVREVATKAFQNNKTITSLHIPASLQIIGAYAFEGAGLTSVTFEDMEHEWNYHANPNSVSTAGTLTYYGMIDPEFVAACAIGGSAMYTWKKAK